MGRRLISWRSLRVGLAVNSTADFIVYGTDFQNILGTCGMPRPSQGLGLVFLATALGRIFHAQANYQGPNMKKAYENFLWAFMVISSDCQELIMDLNKAPHPVQQMMCLL